MCVDSQYRAVALSKVSQTQVLTPGSCLGTDSFFLESEFDAFKSKGYIGAQVPSGSSGRHESKGAFLVLASPRQPCGPNLTFTCVEGCALICRVQAH